MSRKHGVVRRFVHGPENIRVGFKPACSTNIAFIMASVYTYMHFVVVVVVVDYISVIIIVIIIITVVDSWWEMSAVLGEQTM